jgi:hypothetical protein
MEMRRANNATASNPTDIDFFVRNENMTYLPPSDIKI